MARLRVLVVGDEKNVCSPISAGLANLGCTVRPAANAEAALAALAEVRFDLAFLRLGEGSTTSLLPRLLAAQAGLAVVVVAAGRHIDQADAAVKQGAVDYLLEPFPPAHVEHVVERLASHRALQRRVVEMEAELRHTVPDIDLASDAPAMRAAIETVKRAAAVDAPVLLTGEHGTGKHVLARHLHSESPRQAMPFAAVRCAAAPEHAVAREIFGHARSDAAGDVHSDPGCIEAIEGGTLFLDDVGALTPPLQSKLLRLLEERKFERMGESQTRHADVRVVAATHRDLEADIREHRFNRDLLHRLNVVDVHLPPLRQRPADILRLARGFVAFFAVALGYAPPPISPDAEAALLAHPWPGNVRELRNAIERALILEPGAAITAAVLPGRVDGEGGEVLGGDVTLGDIERMHIQRVLKRHEKADDAARVLGIDPSTLWRKRKKWEE